MDFKVAGTREGITAVQADFKIHGLTLQQVKEIVDRALTARLEILGKLDEAIDEPRKEMSRYAPRVYRLQIPVAKIGAIIGPGGKMVRSIIEETKCSVDVEDDGSVFIGSNNEENAKRAIAIIQGLTAEAEVGKTYMGRVTRTVDFGAFVEIMPGKEGLVRIGELSDHRVPTVEDVVSVGDELEVMVMEIDNLGRINLSHRAILEGYNPEEDLPADGEIPSPMTRRTSSMLSGGMRGGGGGPRGPRPQGGGGGNFNRGGRGRGGGGRGPGGGQGGNGPRPRPQRPPQGG
jgi:polyribonucleotide nucleotidyltransferase